MKALSYQEAYYKDNGFGYDIYRGGNKVFEVATIDEAQRLVSELNGAGKELFDGLSILH